MACVGDEELATDADEPPDELIRLIYPQWPHHLMSDTEYHKSSVLNFERRKSLLTQALTGLESSSIGQPRENLTRGTSTASTCSNTSVAGLTSDGGVTGPSRTNTPSPPLLPNMYPAPIGLLHHTKPLVPIHTISSQDPNDLVVSHASGANVAGTVQESKVEAGLGRKRCISFACARKSSGGLSGETKPEVTPPKTVVVFGSQGSGDPVSVAPRRPCMVKFACPTREQDTPRANRSGRSRLSSPPPPSVQHLRDVGGSRPRIHHDSEATIKPASPVKSIAAPFNPFVDSDIDLERSESTRFHEFASFVDEEEEWMHEPTAHRRKITVDDVLLKEKAIRKMGEEAEEEALQDLEDEELDELASNADNLENDDASDDGNETDDEEGFADSDDESDAGSFWTPGRTTAATSTDSVEHIRPKSHRSSSETSIESMIRQGEAPNVSSESPFGQRKHRQVKIRPGTPDLPDSTDFVCGTLDEDRPLEDAYLSCMKERIRQKHIPIPQDIDPSFPTSEPEDEDELGTLSRNSEEHLWISGQLDDYDDGPVTGHRRSTTKRRSPHHSPKRLHSPPATKRGRVHQSPTPRHLFHSPPAQRRIHSPPPTRRVRSPPPTRRASIAISPKRRAGGPHVHFDGLAARPGLTHTKSLPRTPNPFRHQYVESRKIPAGTSFETSISGTHLNFHGRGAIDIVKGLERKRQRRREKLLHKWCHRAGKDKERKPEPGQGAEKMKELGLVKAGKGKGGFRFNVGQQEAQYMLSV
ncbi:hypothetical protein FGG08_003084 [Glutinoglossum americanum]|uniref:Uncharacterized protein n=1 Tax=Glutinoglossum americanum TaxID=1670608 RepID=A0A9P8IE29_9PEZI|nr:hypothetical protein FGG08_003084 [Glutinoglossum americanum]